MVPIATRHSVVRVCKYCAIDNMEGRKRLGRSDTDMNIAIGLGLDKDPEKAAEEAVKQALRTGPKPGLAGPAHRPAISRT